MALLKASFHNCCPNKRGYRKPHPCLASDPVQLGNYQREIYVSFVLIANNSKKSFPAGNSAFSAAVKWDFMTARSSLARGRLSCAGGKPGLETPKTPRATWQRRSFTAASSVPGLRFCEAKCGIFTPERGLFSTAGFLQSP